MLERARSEGAVDSATSYRGLRIIAVPREMAPAPLSARGRLLLASGFLFWLFCA